jgi:signal transduction histidine kinase
LAAQLGVPAVALRALFVVAGAFRLVGVALYLALWLTMPRWRPDANAPGLAAADRAGLRSTEQPRRLADAGLALALGLLGVGLLWLIQRQDWGLPSSTLIAGGLAALGLAAVWWVTDHFPARNRRLPMREWLGTLLRQWTHILIAGLGLVFVGAAVALVILQVAADEPTRIALVVALSVLAFVLAVAPAWLRVRRELAQARNDRLVADARADMAAHLHDSVLQTLALIQQAAEDPKQVSALARGQERELRSYLYGEQLDEASFGEALTEACADVEQRFGVEVDVVRVGDANVRLGAGQDALVAAAREAMVNAAKHAGVDRLDVYAEIAGGQVSVYVRDRGAGFDPAAIPTDRHGVRDSITERVQRAGGKVIIRSAPGEGTEIRLEMPL